MRKQQKNLIRTQYLGILESKPLILILHYNNYVDNYTSIDDIRSVLYKNMTTLQTNMPLEISLRVVKNRLIRNIVKDTRYKNMSSLFTGPTLLLYSDTASVPVCAMLYQWAKQYTHIQILGGIFKNDLISVSDLAAIINSPVDTRYVHNEYISCVETPVRQLLRVLSSNNDHLHNTILQHNKTEEGIPTK